MVKSDVSFRSSHGRQRRQTLHQLKEIGLAKKLERHSLSPSMLTKCLLNNAQQRVCRCSRYTKTISTYKDTLSGSRATKTETSIACTLAHHECATCRSSA